MDRLRYELLLLTALIASCCTAVRDSVNPDLVNINVERAVDLKTHLPKITTSLTLENTGKSDVKSFLFAIDDKLVDNLSFIGAVTKSSNEDERLDITESVVSAHMGKTFYRIDLPEKLDPEKQVQVDVETIFSHALRPYPSHITQSEKQFVQFVMNVHYYSPYKTNKVKSILSLPTSNIESYTKVKPVGTDDDAITYGPYKDLEPFSQSEATIHYENNSPFLAVTTLMRTIEVSHWGNLAIEETVDIRHTGAKLDGPFSRYDYQRTQDTLSSVKSYKTVLPSAARDVYYRDEIGNISTSHLRDLDDMVEVELRPRFPLFGGWKTHYTIGYNVPSYQYLFQSGDNYKLKMRFIDHIFDDQVIDEMTLRIILPEGSKNTKFWAPFDVRRSPNELHYTYLDTIGRPVVIAHKTNLVEQHLQDFELDYTFSKYMLLQEPVLVVMAFYLLFVIVIIYVRLDFSITKDEASESRMRVAGFIEQIQGFQDRRSALYQSYDDAINKYKASKDLASMTSSRKKIDSDYKNLTGQIAALATKLKAEGSDAAEKVSELQKADASVRELIQQVITFAEKLIAGKMTKQQYVDTENGIRTKREEMYQKMENILASL